MSHSVPGGYPDEAGELDGVRQAAATRPTRPRTRQRRSREITVRLTRPCGRQEFSQTLRRRQKRHVLEYEHPFRDVLGTRPILAGQLPTQVVGAGAHLGRQPFSRLAPSMQFRRHRAGDEVLRVRPGEARRAVQVASCIPEGVGIAAEQVGIEQPVAWRGTRHPVRVVRQGPRPTRLRAILSRKYVI